MRTLRIVGASALAVALVSWPAAAKPPERVHVYETDSMRVGSNAAETQSYAFDLDRNGRRDNALGSLLAALSAQLDVDAAIQAALASGEVAISHVVRARSFDRDAAATWRVDGGDRLKGDFEGGHFEGGPGLIPLRLGVVEGMAPIELSLAEARVRANCDADACAGSLGGAISPAQADAVVIPALAAAMQSVVGRSCPDACSPEALLILSVFDVNQDGLVSADELRANSIIQAVLFPDVDLYRANGKPGQDGITDSLSFAVGFTATAP